MTAMQHSVIPVTPYQQNCSLVICKATRHAALIDPGGDIPRLIEAVQQAGVVLQMLLLTHGHLDHVGGAQELARHFDVPIVGPQQNDAFLLDALPDQARMFGFPMTRSFRPERWLSDGEHIDLGSCRFEVIHLPGHTPGHVVFHNAAEKLVFVGDVLFQGSIGRTDFPRGNHAELIRGIKERLFPLGDDVRFIPGHGPSGTLGQERRHNPFVGIRANTRA